MVKFSNKRRVKQCRDCRATSAGRLASGRRGGKDRHVPVQRKRKATDDYEHIQAALAASKRARSEARSVLPSHL